MFLKSSSGMDLAKNVLCANGSLTLQRVSSGLCDGEVGKRPQLYSVQIAVDGPVSALWVYALVLSVSVTTL